MTHVLETLWMLGSGGGGGHLWPSVAGTENSHYFLVNSPLRTSLRLWTIKKIAVGHRRWRKQNYSVLCFTKHGTLKNRIVKWHIEFY